MRRKISLYIADKLVDLDEDSLVLFTYTMEDLENPVIVKNSYSQQVTIPGTPANNDIFGRYQRLDRVTGTGFNAMERLPFKIYNELNELLVSGYVKLDSVQRKGGKVHSFSLTLYGSLGSYFYDLLVREDGTPANLGDLAYIDADGNQVTPNEQTFPLTAAAIRALWQSLENGQTGLLQSPWWNFFNFAPCLNGVPADFDARKALVTSGVFVDIAPGAGGNDRPHPSANSSYLVTMETDKTESEVRDYRAYLQRPVINIAAFLGALEDRGGFHVSEDVLELITGDLWVTLPLPRRTGSYATYSMKNFFEGSLTPADLLISIAKRFGFVFVTRLDGIHLETRNEFFNDVTVDIERRIDRDSIAVNPMNFTSKWYLWRDEVTGEFADAYRDNWGKVYGEQKVNTGYDFDSGSKVVTDTLKTRGAAQVLDQSRMYVASWASSLAYFPAAMFEKVSFQGYSQNGQDSSTIEVKQYLPSWANVAYYDSENHYYNVMSMPQFQDKGRKPVDGGGVLLYLDGFETLPVAKDSYLRDRLVWKLSDDDSALYALLNAGVPCWDMRDSYGERVASMPHFSRHRGTDSLEFGSPLEIGEILPSYPSGTVYERFWKDYIKDRYDKDTTVVRCKVDLKGFQVGQELLRNFFWFDNSLWVLNRISDYSLTTYDNATCEFVRVQDKDAYLSGIVPPSPPTPPTPPTPPDPPVTDAGITYISPSGSKSVGPGESIVNFVISTNPSGEEVSMSASASWLSWDSNYNELTIQANTLDMVRTASLTFYLTNHPSGGTKTVTIVQEAASPSGVLSASPSSLEVAGAAGSRQFTFSTEPSGADVLADLNGADWLSYNASTKTLSWQKNDTRADRSANIVFYVDGHRNDQSTRTVSVTQHAVYYIDIPQTHATMPYVGGEHLFAYATNGTLRYSTTVGSRIEVVSVEDGIIKLRTSQNPSMEASDNIGSVTFWVNEDSAVSATITLGQAGASDYIIVDPEKYFAEALGGLIEVAIRTDVASNRIGYEVTGDGVTVRAVSSTYIRLFLSPNQSQSALDPKATVRLYNLDKPRVETTLTIAQYGNRTPEPNRT